MTEIVLSQAEADALIALEKHRVDEQTWAYPESGGKVEIPLVSADKREHFLLDISRGRIDLAKTTYQNRARRDIPLVRLDIAGPPHTNPDGETLLCPHLHLYREGYEDKWAFPPPADSFAAPLDIVRALNDFMQYCNISKPPNISRGLF